MTEKMKSDFEDDPRIERIAKQYSDDITAAYERGFRRGHLIGSSEGAISELNELNNTLVEKITNLPTDNEDDDPIIDELQDLQDEIESRIEHHTDTLDDQEEIDAAAELKRFDEITKQHDKLHNLFQSKMALIDGQFADLKRRLDRLTQG